MRHRDVSKWGADMVEYAKARMFVVQCDTHPDCLRDETDEEIAARMHYRSAQKVEVVS